MAQLLLITNSLNEILERVDSPFFVADLKDVVNCYIRRLKLVPNMLNTFASGNALRSSSATFHPSILRINLAA